MTKFVDYHEGSANARLADAHGLGGGRLPPRQKRRNETQELTRPIEAALNALPGVWAARNNTGLLPAKGSGGREIMMRFGLGVGSADIVGCVRTREVSLRIAVNESCSCGGCGPTDPKACGACLVWHAMGQQDYTGCGVAVFFALEVKWPGKKPTEDQKRWAAKLRGLGATVETVHSVDEAIAVVKRIQHGT